MTLFEQTLDHALQKINLQLAANPTMQELGLIADALARIKAAAHPRYLECLNFSAAVLTSEISYGINGLVGLPMLLVVNGLVIPRHKWAWDADGQTLSFLMGYFIATGAVAEIYYLPE